MMPGSVDYLIRRGEVGMKVVRIDAALDIEEKHDGADGMG
jgi:hypothetical protein